MPNPAVMPAAGGADVNALKVEKKAVPANGNVSVAFAVEAGVDGQEILCRPHLVKWVVPA